MIKKTIIILLVVAAALLVWPRPKDNSPFINPVNLVTVATPTVIPPSIMPTPWRISLATPPSQKILANSYHVYQSFNNCGPAALSMALSHYGIRVSQEELGLYLRPYQNALGDNDDKSVTLEELAEKSREYGLIPYHRPNGSMDIVRLFIAYDIPIITRTLLNTGEDIGHYRVIKGYDELSGEIIQDDSLQGSNLRYSYHAFDQLWKQFNYEYLVLVPQGKEQIAESILGDDRDYISAWTRAVARSRDHLAQDPGSINDRFNLSVALYNAGDYQGAVEEFEKIESLLPFRTLWYQIEPIEAYFKLGNYERVLALTDKIINNHNRAFSELYILRGLIFEKRGEGDLAKTELDKAVFYNRNLNTDWVRARFDK